MKTNPELDAINRKRPPPGEFKVRRRKGQRKAGRWFCGVIVLLLLAALLVYWKFGVLEMIP